MVYRILCINIVIANLITILFGPITSIQSYRSTVRSGTRIMVTIKYRSSSKWPKCFIEKRDKERSGVVARLLSATDI